MAIQVKTDNKWKHFKFSSDVPKKVLKDQFDYLELELEGDMFIFYKEKWFHVEDFTRLESKNDLAEKWDGYIADSYFSGIVIKVSKDGESYKIGTYFS